MSTYYNEIDEYAADWLEALIAERLIPHGVVDRRSIVDVRAADLDGFVQCHFFAGLGGWPLSFRRADWPDDRPVWSGSCPCQPFSLAGARKGFADDRHLWPVWRELIAQRRPPTVFGEQVASATAWLRLVRGDLEALGYAVGAIPIEAASAGADHLRDRFWFVAEADQLGESERREQRGGEFGGAGRDQEACAGDVADRSGIGQRRAREPEAGSEPQITARGLRAAGDLGLTDCGGWQAGEQAAAASRHGSAAEPTGGDLEWVVGADGKARRVKPGIRLLAHGVPARVAKLRAFGNAIDPRPAAEFIRAAM